jgi:hypothetical protein
MPGQGPVSARAGRLRSSLLFRICFGRSRARLVVWEKFRTDAMTVSSSAVALPGAVDMSHPARWPGTICGSTG